MLLFCLEGGLLGTRPGCSSGAWLWICVSPKTSFLCSWWCPRRQTQARLCWMVQMMFLRMDLRRQSSCRLDYNLMRFLLIFSFYLLNGFLFSHRPTSLRRWLWCSWILMRGWQGRVSGGSRMTYQWSNLHHKVACLFPLMHIFPMQGPALAWCQGCLKR